MPLGLRRPALVLVMSSLAAVGCADRPPAENDCPSRPSPAFLLTLRTQSGEPLPGDAHVVIAAGSGKEDFDAATPPAAPDLAFCTGAGEGGVTELTCKLWTNGAAELSITASGYQPVKRTLVAETDPCGIKTVDVKVSLEPLARK